MCTLEVNVLSDNFDVHGTRDSDVFTLHAPSVFQACEEIGSPNVFCLLPPTIRLQSMCSSPLDSIFNDVLNGKYTTLDSLPIVWDSLFEDSSEPWIPITNTSPNEIYSNLYLGLQPLPFFNDMVVSDLQRVLFGVFGGVLFQSNAATGFVQKRLTVTGQDDNLQAVVVNGAGTMGAILFRDRLFFYQQSNFVEVTSPTHSYHAIQLYEEATLTKLIIVGRDNNSTAICTLWNFAGSVTFSQTKQTDINIGTNSSLQWVGLTDGFEHTLIAVDAFNSFTYNVYLASNLIGGPAPVLQWQVTRVAPDVFFAGRWFTICRGNMSTTTIVIMTSNVLASRLLRVELPTGGNVASTILVSSTTARIFEPLNRQFFAFVVSSTGLLFVATAPSTIASVVNVQSDAQFQLHGNYPLAFASDKLWCYLPNIGQLYFNTNTSSSFGNVFTSTFELHVNELAHVSDYGLLELLPQPSITWFFGYATFQTVHAGDVLLSPHEYYRIVIDPVVQAPAGTFAHVTSRLERANFMALAQGNAVQLFDNSETKIVPVNDTSITLWQRGTNDQFSSQEEATLITNIEGKKTMVSPNGLYILVFSHGPDVGARVVYNLYNSAAFADYTQFSKERLSRAIDRQQEFCWTQLLQEDTETRDAQVIFSDRRCTCIAGERLVERIFTSDNALLVSNTRARLSDNLPCMLTSCQEALASPEITNVSNAMYNKCQNAQLTLCSSLLSNLGPQGNNTFHFGNGVVTQNCGINLTACAQDTDCPLGSTCVGGTCVTNCTSNADCLAGAQCQMGLCIEPSAAANNNTAQIAAIVLAVFVALALFVFLMIWFLKYKKKNPPRKS